MRKEKVEEEVIVQVLGDVLVPRHFLEGGDGRGEGFAFRGHMY